MILMPIIMLSPLAGLLLFYYAPLSTALPIYILILIVAGYCNALMFWSMRAGSKTGPEAMIGQSAMVAEPIDPEGKVEINAELWWARARDAKIAAGRPVRIVEVKGLILIVEDLAQEGRVQKDGLNPGGRNPRIKALKNWWRNALSSGR